MLTSTSETAERSSDDRTGAGIVIEGEEVMGELGAVEIVWSSSDGV